MITRSSESVKKCGGACEFHTGEVVAVIVRGWGMFSYCQSAIEEDRRNGLTVIELDKAETEEESK